MKKTLIALLALTFVLSFNSCKKNGKLSGNSKLIPEGTNAVAEINVSDFMKLEKVKKEIAKEGKEFTKKTGIKPSDVKSLTIFATVDKLRNLERKPNFGVLINGNGFTKDIFKNIPKGFKKLKYAGTTIFNDNGMGFALTKKTIVGGTVNNTKKILDLSNGKGKAANLKEFSKIFSKLNASSAKAAVIVPKTTRNDLAKIKSPMPMAGLNQVLQKIEIIALGANVSSSSIEVKLVVKSDAKAIKTLVSGLNALLKTMLAPQATMMDKKMPGIKDAYDSLKIVADGNYLKASVKIPAKLLDKM